MVALAVAIGIGRFVYTPILPPMQAALGLNAFAAGLIASANFAGYLVGALAAALPLPGSRRAWLAGGLASSTLTTGAMGLVRGVPAFLALRFAGGAASAFGLVFASAIVLERLAESGRLGLSSVLFAGVGTGIALSALLVSAMRWAGFGWSGLWIASGLLSAAGTLAAAALIAPEEWREAYDAPLRAARISAALLRLIAAYGLFGFGYVITATFLVAIVRATTGLRPLEPVIWVVFGLAAAPSVLLWSRIARRIGLGRAFALAAVVEALGVLASVGLAGAGEIFLSAVLVGGTFMGLTALGLMAGRTLARGDARPVLALMTGAFGLGQIIGPSFAGALYDRLGSFAVPSLAAAAALVTAALLAAA